jgi:Dihydrodipicolinate synthetase family
MALSPERLKSAIGSGLLSFPVTHFAGNGAFTSGPYQEHIDYLVGHRPAALFAAGGTGEFFSLQLAEYESVIAAMRSASSRPPSASSADLPGPVRAPLLDLTADQEATLARLVACAVKAVELPSQPAMRAQVEARSN